MITATTTRMKRDMYVIDQGLKDLQYDLETVSYDDTSKTIVSLHGIAFLLRTLSLLSRDMNRFVTSFLDEALVDVYFQGIPRGQRLFCILWIRKRRLSLSSIRMGVGSGADMALVLSMLRHCDTDQCRWFNICSEKTLRVFCQGKSCMIRSAWYAKFGSGVIDLTESTPTALGVDARLCQLGVEKSESDFALIRLTDRQFFDLALKECPNIEVLKLRVPKMVLKKQTLLSKSLSIPTPPFEI